MIVYDDKEIAKISRGGFQVGELDATRLYLQHYDNYLYLSFIIRETKDWKEKRQALKEIAIAERKMTYWKRQGNFSQDEATRGMLAAKKRWNVKETT